MHTLINTLPTNSRLKAPANASLDAFREPAYDCQEQGEAVKLIVYVPGVDASGVEIEGRGPDLTVTAKKSRFVRVNFTALHLEGVQRDYRLRLRLGTGFDYAAMAAEFANGVLTVTLPKRAIDAGRLRRVAA
jgi:HSP20 family molecular chaperone IbpA